ncbi:MAG: DUF1858 domain-containing protein [Firmicutes bacterium]|jgi:hybrid cluster-associated redox disulfide protein|nr:DUF1858 domain-containing protein [Bacillota bacterium]
MRVTKEMTIFEIIRAHPQAAAVFAVFNMACSDCMAVIDDTLEQGARQHSIDLEQLLIRLNALFAQEGKE